MADCTDCADTGTVCESHPNLPWPSACDCDAGMPCPVCTTDAAPFVPAALSGMTTTEVRRMQGYRTIATVEDA